MANITATKISGANEDTTWLWEAITENDTALELEYPGGECFVEVKGTFGSATVQLQFGLTSGGQVNLSDTEAPEGASFTAAGIVLLDLPAGYLLPSISGGSSQDIDITVVMKNRKT